MGDDLDELVKDKLVEFHIDRVEVLYGLMLEIQGWTTDQRGNVEVTVHKENTELLDCKITRGRRPDVVERRHLDDDYKNQEIGFSISAAFLEIPGNRIVLHFCGDSTTKTYEIDIKAPVKSRNPKDSGDAFFIKTKMENTRKTMKSGSNAIKLTGVHSENRDIHILSRIR